VSDVDLVFLWDAGVGHIRPPLPFLETPVPPQKTVTSRPDGDHDAALCSTGHPVHDVAVVDLANPWVRPMLDGMRSVVVVFRHRWPGRADAFLLALAASF